jgi:hypothetical protein
MVEDLASVRAFVLGHSIMEVGRARSYTYGCRYEKAILQHTDRRGGKKGLREGEGKGERERERESYSQS